MAGEDRPKTLGDVAKGSYVNVFGERVPMPEVKIRLRKSPRPLNHVLVKLRPRVGSAIGRLCHQTGLRRRMLIHCMIAYCLNHESEFVKEIEDWRSKP